LAPDQAAGRALLNGLNPKAKTKAKAKSRAKGPGEAKKAGENTGA